MRILFKKIFRQIGPLEVGQAGRRRRMNGESLDGTRESAMCAETANGLRGAFSKRDLSSLMPTP